MSLEISLVHGGEGGIPDPGLRCTFGTSLSPSNPHASKAVCSLLFLARFTRCGEGGIRTHGTFRHTVFPGLPIKPLLHLSVYNLFWQS